MPNNLNDGGLLFTGPDETGVALPTNPGVTVRQVIPSSDGHPIDLLYLTVAYGAEISRESHPYSETLVVIVGELTCRIEDGEPVTVRPGQIWHIPPDVEHVVRNTGDSATQLALLVGI